VIGKDGAQSIAESLKRNSTLKYLDLRDNFVRAKGAQSFADCLKVNFTLLHLDLRRNGIENQGTIFLAKSLVENSTLTHLSLFGNHISNFGVQALASSLKINSTLQSLELEKNSFGKEGFKALVNCFSFNHTLSHLNINNTTLSVDNIRILDDFVQRNKIWKNRRNWLLFLHSTNMMEIPNFPKLINSKSPAAHGSVGESSVTPLQQQTVKSISSSSTMKIIQISDLTREVCGYFD
jgi:Ran GTPase-activating protein (RanGAP) involved in mRNA processing and transport